MSEKLKAAAQQALTAMDYMLHYGEWYQAQERAEALRAALAEPEPVQEPAAWLDQDINAAYTAAEMGGDSTEGLVPLYATPPKNLAEPEAAQEPVAWMWEETASRTSTGIGGVDRKLLFCRPVDEPWKRNITPLYTHPPQRPSLTDEEIEHLSRTMVGGNKSVQWLARIIERKVRGEKE